MNLDDVKTGDRLWTMLFKTSANNSDLLTDLAPYEVIYLSTTGGPTTMARLDKKGYLINAAKCAIMDTGSIMTAMADKLHPTRDEAIRQAKEAIEARIRVLKIAHEGYIDMLDRPLA